MSYGELDELSGRLAAGLAASGIGPGDVVALQLPNIPQFLIAYFGILKAGGVVVPLNVMLKAPEVAFHLRDSSAKALITWTGALGQAGPGAAEAGVTQVYAVGDGTGAAPFEQLLSAPSPGHAIAQRDPADTAVIMYTSGTTGRSKGAELTHLQLYMNADIPGRLFNVQPDDIVITVLPLFHVFGLSSIVNVRPAGTADPARSVSQPSGAPRRWRPQPACSAYVSLPHAHLTANSRGPARDQVTQPDRVPASLACGR
jgi:long-chain acyl-CoA synthetase